MVLQIFAKGKLRFLKYNSSSCKEIDRDNKQIVVL